MITLLEKSVLTHLQDEGEESFVSRVRLPWKLRLHTELVMIWLWSSISRIHRWQIFKKVFENCEIKPPYVGLYDPPALATSARTL